MLNLPVERLDKKTMAVNWKPMAANWMARNNASMLLPGTCFIVNWKITDLILYAATNAFSKMLLYLGLIHLDDFVQFFGKLSDMVAAFPG